MVTPLSLNEKNAGYGGKDSYGVGRWESALRLLANRQNDYESGAFQRVIDDGLDWLNRKGVTSRDGLQQMTEVELATLFYLGMAYQKSGRDHAAIAALAIVYSQAGFSRYMLGDFAGYTHAAGEALEELASHLGPEAVANPKLDTFFATVKNARSGGCFIATAAYGTPLAPEIGVLSAFRDEVLLPTLPGAAFVRFYYKYSPPIAAAIAPSQVRKALVRHCAIRPLVWLVRRCRS